jgi:hypothetical protein
MSSLLIISFILNKLGILIFGVFLIFYLTAKISSNRHLVDKSLTVLYASILTIFVSFLIKFFFILKLGSQIKSGGGI